VELDRTLEIRIPSNATLADLDIYIFAKPTLPKNSASSLDVKLWDLTAYAVVKHDCVFEAEQRHSGPFQLSYDAASRCANQLLLSVPTGKSADLTTEGLENLLEDNSPSRK